MSVDEGAWEGSVFIVTSVVHKFCKMPVTPGFTGRRKLKMFALLDVSVFDWRESCGDKQM